MRKRLTACAAALAFATWTGEAHAAPEKRLPFSEEEDADGSFFVWLAYDQSGAGPFERVPARELGSSPSFRKVAASERQPGDIAAWRDLVAMIDQEQNLVLGGGRTLALADVERKRGPATWYRWQQRRKTPEKVSRAKLGASFEAVNPDPHVWLRGRGLEDDAKFKLELDRRPIRMMNGEDGVAVLALVGEVVYPVDGERDDPRLDVIGELGLEAGE